MMSNTIDRKYIKMNVEGIDIYTFPFKIKDLITISYVAVRGRDREAGAVQRVLNKKRIDSIKQYVLDGNLFINTFILNWTDENTKPVFESNAKIPVLNASAQLIDGQHRLEGIKEAAKINPDIYDKEVLVSMAMNLGTKDAAKIFININSEQKPVPRSLIYDLYGVTDEDKNYAITRAGDIAKELNENIESPYYNFVKFPGMAKSRGKIDLSTIVNSLKKDVDTDGKFYANNIRDLNNQSQIVINYFSALRYFWEEENLWVNSSQNVFFKASGFVAAMEFFFEEIFMKCVNLKSFTKETIIGFFDFTNVSLITNNDIKNSDGKSSRKMIKENLREGLKAEAPQEEEYDI